MPRTLVIVMSFLVFLQLGCAAFPIKSNRSKSPTAEQKNTQHKGGPLKLSEEPPEPPQKEDLPLPADALKAEHFDFRPELMKWAERARNATYKKVALEAQKLIKKNGLLYTVDVKTLLPKTEGYKAHKLEDGRELLISTANAFEGTCGELFVKISVLSFKDGNPVVLTNQGPLIVKGLLLEKTLVRKSESDNSGTILYRPRAEAPWNVTNDGKALIWQYDLKQALIMSWWQKLTRRYRELREERPFLAIRITDSDFIVETYEKILLPAAYEQVNPNTPDDPNLIRRIYKPKSIAVDFDSPCT